MKVALLAQSIEVLEAEILNITKKNAFGGGDEYKQQGFRSIPADLP